MTAFELRDERQNLDDRERAWLADLARGPVSWGPRRQFPPSIVNLLRAGLAFRSVVGFTITPLGEEVLERVS